ncbi:MAG: glycoside hydrolase family 3 N-terminal domain-containing protein [Chitinophagaceae bacterium]
MSRTALLFSLLLMAACSEAKPPVASNAESKLWVDSVYSRLNENERIGQLFMVAAYSGGPNFNAPAIEKLLKNHQIGGLIFMQGGPVRQANLTNRFQEMAQVPLLLAMDAEWGLGMRLDSVVDLPKQMTIGATNDSGLAYVLGAAVAAQCRRIGVHVDFAPVVDVNNNPANPVINARSFGEDKYRVAKMGIAYMKGLQDFGIMACAKHFPGHGDVTVDSHKDLPLISKSRAQLDSLELYPFREMIHAGVQSMMVAHLEVPALEKEPHVPTTLSKNTVTNLLKKELGFKGLVFTDALDMKGVAKYFNHGEADVRAFIAGNDVLLFSQDVPLAIQKIKAAIAEGKVPLTALETSVKKILKAKYDAGLSHFTPINTNNLVADINQYTATVNQRVAEAAITLVRNKEHLIPIPKKDRVLQIFLGAKMPKENPELTARCSKLETISTIENSTIEDAALKANSSNWDVIVIAVEGLSFYPGKSYGLDAATLAFINKMALKKNVIIAMMGNAYALKYACNAPNLICGFEGNEWTVAALQNVLSGKQKATGILPVTPPCLR